MPTYDIKDAAILTVNSKDYPIIACEKLTATSFSRPGIARMATVTASTKKAATITGGKSDTFATHISSLKCMPLDPVDAKTQARLVTAQGVRTLHTLLDLYPLDGTNGYAHLVLEELLN